MSIKEFQYSADLYKKRVFIYIRVSTDKQAEEGYSIPQQTERLIKYCEAMGWQVVKVYTDDGYSGGDLRRPAMKQMIRDIEKGNADIVLVDKLDRLSRSQFDTLYMIQKVFEPNNTAFVSRAEAFDTSTPFGKAMVGILAVFAELERARIKERMADGKEGRAKEGKYRGGGMVAIGYDYNRETGILEINEYEAMMIREIFDMILARTPMNAIADTLNDKGYVTKYGKWHDNTIRYMATNRVYIGMIRHKGTWYQGLHKPIISSEKFEAVGKIMEERKITFEKFKPGKRYSSPLGGLIWCKKCGGKYGYRTTGKNKDGSKLSYYICYSRAKTDPTMVRDPNCKNKSYRDFVLDEIIYDEIRKLKTDSSYFDELRNSIDNTDKIELISGQIDELDNQMSRLMDLYSVKGINIDSISEKIQTLSEQKEKLEEELYRLELENSDVEKDTVLDLVDMFEDSLASGNSVLIHDVVMQIIDHIEIDGEDIIIHWNF